MDTEPLDAPRTGSDRSGPNVLDLLIKYAAAAAAFAYALGVVQEQAFLQQLGSRGSSSLTSPVHFLMGAGVLSVTLLPAVGVSAYLGFGTPLLNIRKCLLLIIPCALISGLGIFGLAFTETGSLPGESFWMAGCAALICGGTVWQLTQLAMGRRSSAWRQLFLLYLLMILSALFASGLGRLQGMGTTAHSTLHRSRILVSADAVRGAGEMGLAFPEWRPGDNSAQLSDEVDIVLDDGQTLLLRTHGQLVHLNKDKVLGSMP